MAVANISNSGLFGQKAKALSATVGGGLVWGAGTGGALTSFVGNGTNGEIGKTYNVHSFTSSSSFTVTKLGIFEILVCSAGGYSITGHGNGGQVIQGLYEISTLGSRTITVGAVAGAAPSGGSGVVGTVFSAKTANQPNGDVAVGAGSGTGGNADGFTSLITGTSTVYGQARNPSVRGGGGSGSNSNGNAGIVIIRYQV
jgi:hypothetical protein